MVWISAFPNDKQDHMANAFCFENYGVASYMRSEGAPFTLHSCLLILWRISLNVSNVMVSFRRKWVFFILHCFLYIILRVDEQPTWLSMTPNSSNLLALCLFIVHNAKMCVTCSNWIELTDDFFCIQQRVSQPASHSQMTGFCLQLAFNLVVACSFFAFFPSMILV